MSSFVSEFSNLQAFRNWNIQIFRITFDFLEIQDFDSSDLEILKSIHTFKSNDFQIFRLSEFRSFHIRVYTL